MKTVLLTGFSESFAPIGWLTSHLMKEYAERHGMAFAMTPFFPETHAGWDKIKFILSLCEEYDRILWMDADVVVTNPQITPWKYHEKGLHVSKDWSPASEDNPSGFSMGCFLLCQDAFPIFQEVAMHRALWPDEQQCIQNLYDTLEWVNENVTVHPRRVFNAVPAEAWPPDVVEPWQANDWICHLTMMSVQQRVDFFHRIMDKPAC